MAVANQKIIIGHKTKPKAPFVSISLDKLAIACKLLTPSGVLLWIYMHKTCSADKWQLKHSDVENYTNISKKTYDRAVEELIKYGYLRLIKGVVTYEFNYCPYERYLELEEKPKDKVKKKQSTAIKIELQEPVVEQKQQADEPDEEDIYIEGLDEPPEPQKPKLEGRVIPDNEVNPDWESCPEFDVIDELDELAQDDNDYEDADFDLKFDL